MRLDCCRCLNLGRSCVAHPEPHVSSPDDEPTRELDTVELLPYDDEAADTQPE